MTFLRKSDSSVSSLNEVISTCSTMFLLLWEQRLQQEFCHNTFHAKILCQISDAVVFGIPRSASSSHTVSRRSLLIAAHTRSAFSGAPLVAGLPERGSLSADSQPSLKHLYHIFICAALTALSLKDFWIIWIVSMEECLSSMQIWCKSIVLLAQSFFNVTATHTHAHSMVSTTPTE